MASEDYDTLAMQALDQLERDQAKKKASLSSGKPEKKTASLDEDSHGKQKEEEEETSAKSGTDSAFESEPSDEEEEDEAESENNSSDDDFDASDEPKSKKAKVIKIAAKKQSSSDDGSDSEEEPNIKPKKKAAGVGATSTKATIAKKHIKSSAATGTAVVTGNPVTVVMDYMKQKNRPFNAATLGPNLGMDLSAGKLKKILDDGVEAGELREAGEGKIYFANQDSIQVMSLDEAAKVKKEQEELEQALLSLAKIKAKKQTDISRLEKEPNETELPLAFRDLEAEVTKLVAELGEQNKQCEILQKKSTHAEINVKELQLELKFYSDEHKKRKNGLVSSLKDIAGMISKNWMELSEDIGLDQDK